MLFGNLVDGMMQACVMVVRREARSKNNILVLCQCQQKVLLLQPHLRKDRSLYYTQLAFFNQWDLRRSLPHTTL